MEEKVVRFATTADPLLACSICRSLLREAVQLKCLHNCCRQCFSTAASKDGCQDIVCCGVCGASTYEGSEKPNGFIDCQVKSYMTISESRTCGKCRENGEPDKSALVWCPACRHSLCGDCVASHRQYYRQHVTRSFEELRGMDDVCSEPSAAPCTIHNMSLDIACLNCQEAKCIICWATCKEKKHEVHIIIDKSFDSYLVNLVDRITSDESELLLKSVVLETPRNVLRGTKAARDRHLEDLTTRKRLVMDAVEMAYQKVVLATKNAYDDLEAEGEAATDAAERIASDLSDARSYIHRLIESNDKREIFKQEKIVRERLNFLSAELDNLNDRLTKARDVKIEASLPEDVEDVVRAWIGMPQICSVSASAHPPIQQQQEQQQQEQQQQSFSFNSASARFKLPVCCWDVALTKDGRSLLLAAWEHGLIELSSSCGHELSRWLPPNHKLSSSSQDDVALDDDKEFDNVVAVAALSDRRAAVSLQYAPIVVLLRRSEQCSSSTDGAAAAAGDDAWTEDRRIELLLWHACLLSAHGDVLATSEGRLDEQDNTLGPGTQLQLLSLSSGRPLSAELQREYDILSLAVAATVITGGKVELGDSLRPAYVLDAHRLTDDGSDERLWRHVLSSSDSEEEEDELYGVCIDSGGGCLYAAVHTGDASSGRVSALSLADGTELRRFALSFSPAAATATQPQLLLPAQLSLSDDEAVSAEAAKQQNRGRRTLLLAALCWDSSTKQWRTVTLHSSNSDTLP